MVVYMVMVMVMVMMVETRLVMVVLKPRTYQNGLFKSLNQVIHKFNCIFTSLATLR